MSDAADEIADVAEDIAKKRAASAAEQAQIAKLAETAKIVAAIPGNPAAILPAGRYITRPPHVARGRSRVPYR
jgi:hypothetical protein